MLDIITWPCGRVSCVGDVSSFGVFSPGQPVVSEVIHDSYDDDGQKDDYDDTGDRAGVVVG